MAGREEAETSVKFALMIMSVGAEELDMMRIEALNICGIKRSTDELSAMSAQEKIAAMRASRIKLPCAGRSSGRCAVRMSRCGMARCNAVSVNG